MCFGRGPAASKRSEDGRPQPVGVSVFQRFLPSRGSVVYSLQWSGFKLGSTMRRRKSEPGKLTMAARLWRETTLWLKAIAAGDGLGTSEERKCSAARMDETKPIRIKNEPFYGLTPFSLALPLFNRRAATPGALFQPQL